jgi:sterol desaturase/sphingolipid hydroxylase (fatty acid hydroxylase superfamily)
MKSKSSKYKFEASERHRKIWLLLLTPFYILIAGGIASVPIVEFLQMFSVTPIAEAYDLAVANNTVGIVIAAVLTVCFFRFYFSVNDFLRYEKVMGHKLPLRYLLVFPLSIIVFTLGFFILSASVSFLLSIFTDTSFSVTFLFNRAGDMLMVINENIPTLIELPRALAVVILFLLWTFLLYFFHRLGHNSRLFWLLSHRPHHIPTVIGSFTGFNADQDFVLGFLWKFLWVSIPMLVSKLIYPDPIIVEFILILCVWGIFDGMNHQSTYYESIMSERTLSLKIFKKIHSFFNTGPYHVLHHSSLLEHQMVNLCSHFFLWDKMFGTHCEPPKKLPTLGLTDQPEIHFTPLNIVFSGLLQILYELKHNKSLGTRLKIIFGHIEYVPPISKSYLIIENGKRNHLLHKN